MWANKAGVRKFWQVGGALNQTSHGLLVLNNYYEIKLHLSRGQESIFSSSAISNNHHKSSVNFEMWNPRKWLAHSRLALYAAVIKSICNFVWRTARLRLAYFQCSTDIITGGEVGGRGGRSLKCLNLKSIFGVQWVIKKSFSSSGLGTDFIFWSVWFAVHILSRANWSSPALASNVHFLCSPVLRLFSSCLASDLGVIHAGVVWDFFRSYQLLLFFSALSSSPRCWLAARSAQGVALKQSRSWYPALAGEYGVVTAFPASPPVPSHTDCRVTAEAGAPLFEAGAWFFPSPPALACQTFPLRLLASQKQW